MLCANLRFAARHHIRPVGTLFQQRMSAQGNRCNLLDRNREPLLKFQATINYRVDDNTAGIGFVDVLQGLPTRAQIIDHIAVLRILPGHMQESAHPFERLWWSIVILLREQSGQQPTTCGTTNTDAFRHKAQCFDQTRCLRRCTAHSPGQLLRIKAKDLPHRQRRTKNTAGGSNVPTARVMIRRDCITDAAGELHPKRQRMNELPSVYRTMFCQRK